jgi:opacity protein-like surface antigen
MIRIAVATVVFMSGLLPLSFAQDSSAEPPAAQTAPAQTPPENTAPPVSPAIQILPKVQVFAGYSLLHADTGIMNGTNLDGDLHVFQNTLIPRVNFFNGWNAEGQYNFTPWVGGAVDVSGYSGFPLITEIPTVSGLPNGNSYSILAGPVVTERNWGKTVPYAHALFGWNRQSVTASTLTGTSSPLSASATTYNDFVMAFGVGMDYKVTSHVAVRLGQVEWFHTSLNVNSFYGRVFNSTLIEGFQTHEDNLRFSAGIVINFKPQKITHQP